MANELPESRSKRPLPDTARALKGLNLNKLIKYAPPYVKSKARSDIVVKKISKRWTKGGMKAVQAIAVNMKLKVPEPKTVTIIGLDAKSNPSTKIPKTKIPALSKQKRLQVDCTCEDFLYTWEVALWSYGAAKIKRSNGEHPVAKNPGLYPGSCKHIVAVLRQIRDNAL